MKTFVLTVSNNFPQTHPKKGDPTYFPGKILDEIKIHTIRANYAFWAKRVDMINKGQAVLSVRHWYDKPYRSRQVSFAEFEEVGIEKLTFPSQEISVRFINGSPCFYHLEDIAKNDGLSYIDFYNWFKDYDLSKPMAIIHFTNFRYSES